jgi:hypothetical protein
MPRLELEIAVDQRAAEGGAADVTGEGPRVSGTVLGPDGRVSAFVGWVGLLALVQQAIAEPPPPPSSTGGTG